MKELRATVIVFLAALALGSCGVLSGGSTAEAPAAPSEVRASWVVRHAMVDQARVDRVVNDAVEAGINTLIVQVRGRGDAYYRGGLEPAAEALGAGSFDPLEYMVQKAHEAGVQVHAWVNANLVWNPSRPCRDPGHLVNRHPEWLMFPEDLSETLLALPPEHPDFRRTLLEHVEANRGSVEGLYADPSNRRYRAHLASVCADIVRRYAVDGLHLDYIRCPGPTWGYSRVALDGFRVEVDRELSSEDRDDMARRLRDDPLLYTRRYPIRWSAYRRDAVTRQVTEVGGAVRRVRPRVVVSAAVFPDIADARDRRFQAWPQWLDRGLLDVACPMNYATAEQRPLFEDRALAAVGARGPGRVWIGIGAWRLAVHETVNRVRFARGTGAQGVVLFSHNGLQEKPGAFTTLRSEVFSDQGPGTAR